MYRPLITSLAVVALGCTSTPEAPPTLDLISQARDGTINYSNVVRIEGTTPKYRSFGVEQDGRTLHYFDNHDDKCIELVIEGDSGPSREPTPQDRRDHDRHWSRFRELIKAGKATNSFH